MRIVLSTLALLWISASSAAALQPSDTVRAWAKAGAAERAALLDHVFGQRKGEASVIRRCLDDAAAIPGHADLQISELIKGCVSQSPGDPA